MRLKGWQEHLNKWLLLYTAGAMLLGLLAGCQYPWWPLRHQALVGGMTTVAVFFVIYPMMVNLKMESLLKAGRNIKGLSLTMIYNFLWAPLVGSLPALIFLGDPLLSLGFLLVMVVPCSSMSIAYTGLAEGDIELATVAVALSFVLAVFAVPLWMMFFASHYAVAVPLRDMLISILTVLIAPMVLGYLTRRVLVTSLGGQWYLALQPLFPALSLMGLYVLILLIFFAKAAVIVEKWRLVLILLIPNAFFVALTLMAVTWLDRRLRLSYKEHMAVIFASTGKNNGTAIAATAFSPLVAVPAATMPIFQILFLVLYLKAAPRIKRYFKE